MADERPRFKVEGNEYPLADTDDLTFEELEMLEDAFGMAYEDIDWRRAKSIRWLIYLSMRRGGSDVKFEDLGSVKFSDFSDVEEEPETNGAKAKRPTKAAKSG